LHQAAEAVRSARNNEDASDYLAEESVFEALAGNRELAIRQAKASLALATVKYTERRAGTALALARFPGDTQVCINRTIIQAGIFSARGTPARPRCDGCNIRIRADG
jgi:hypothetical protein